MRTETDRTTPPTLDNFTRAYLVTALWSTVDDAGEPMDDRYTVDDFAPEALAAAVADCAAFQTQNAIDIAAGPLVRPRDFDGADGRAGHDFWLTRNHHGAGFWDGDWPEDAGDRLTASAHGFGEADVYEGDDGQLYISCG